MSKTAEEMLKDHQCWSDFVPMPDGSTVSVHAIKEFAAQEVAKEVEAYKYALKAELQSRVNGTRGLEHLSFEDISEIIDTVK